MNRLVLRCVRLWFFSLAWIGVAWANADDEIVWHTQLRPQYFGTRAIDETHAVIDIEAPYRAEDPALVPVRVIGTIPQTPERYIKTLTLFIDKNPVPFVGEFHFTPASGKADIAMRVRVNTYSHLRAIAETNDGQLSMKKVFIKASGGCSAPLGADVDAALQRLGKMKFRLDEGVALGQPTLAQLLISHPNLTGMQMDQMTRFVRPKHFVEQLNVTFEGEPVLRAKTDIAISADPNFRFYFVPQRAGVLQAEIIDSKGDHYRAEYPVQP